MSSTPTTLESVAYVSLRIAGYIIVMIKQQIKSAVESIGMCCSLISSVLDARAW